MKFSKIIINPPYSSNLHVLIADKLVREIVDFQDNGCIISLQPFLNFYRATIDIYNSNDEKLIEEFLIPKIEKLIKISADESRKNFDIRILSDIAIFKFSELGKIKIGEINDLWKEYQLLNKIVKHRNFKPVKDIVDRNEYLGIRVNFVDVSSLGNKEIWKKNRIFTDGYDKQGNWWGKAPYTNNQYVHPEPGEILYRKSTKNFLSHRSKNTKEDLIIPFIGFFSSLKCETETIAENIVKTMQTKFVTFCYLHKIDPVIKLRYIPWIKANYEEGPVTDEDFYRIFELTKNEIKLIERYYAKI